MRTILLGLALCVAAPALAQQPQQQPQPQTPAALDIPVVAVQVEDCPYYDYHRDGGDTRRIVQVCNRHSTERVKFFWDQQGRSSGGGD